MAAGDPAGHRFGGAPRSSHYEYRELRLDPATTTSDAQKLLVDAAEYGRWELARTLRFAGGERRVWLRRRIITVRSTLQSS